MKVKKFEAASGRTPHARSLVKIKIALAELSACKMAE